MFGSLRTAPAAVSVRTAMNASPQRGFTLVEVVIALLVLTVGALGLAAETAALSRQIARSRRTAWVSAAAALRLERLRAAACGAHADGTELVQHGGAVLAALHWSWSETGAGHVVQLVTVPPPPVSGGGPAVTADTLRAVVTCGA